MLALYQYELVTLKCQLIALYSTTHHQVLAQHKCWLIHPTSNQPTKPIHPKIQVLDQAANTIANHHHHLVLINNQTRSQIRVKRPYPLISVLDANAKQSRSGLGHWKLHPWLPVS